jgi:surface antigen
MPEARAGNISLLARVRARFAPSRGLRRLSATGLPAVMAVGGAAGIVPILTSGSSIQPSYSPPSRILCTGWQRCDTRGYDSYGYSGRGWRAYWRMSPGDECTNYAAYVESTVYHVATPSYLLGNGGQWAYTAAAHGVLVNHTPAVGAVAEWDGGTFGIGPMGHVGVVEAVGPHDKYIVISQQHMGGLDGYNWTLIKAHQSADAWQEWPSHFIHFRIPRRAGIGYFNPRSDTFGLRDSLTSGPAGRTGHLGFKGVVPLIGDWRGGGVDAMGYYDARYGTFHLLGAGAGGAAIKARFGPPHMIPLVGDWNGKGRDGIGFYDPATGTFYLRQSQKYGPADEKFTFGPPHMIPLAGDWNGDGKDGIGYYNPKTGIFNLRNSLSHGRYAVSFHFGPPHMIPIVGNWTGVDRHDGVGYYNPWAGKFYLRDRAVKGSADAVIRFGPARMTPLAGIWFGG